MAQSQVPKFGNWESEENVPYTAYFDKARKGRSGGRTINPNDPQDKPDRMSDNAPPVEAPPSRTGLESEIPVGLGAVKPKHERRSSREDGDLRQPTDSPSRNENVGRRTSSDSLQRHDRGPSSGDTPKKAGRQSTGSDRSIEHSPLHPHYQARVGGKGSGSVPGGGSGSVTGGGSGSARSSPSSERKQSEGSHGLAPSTPGRSRLRSVTRGDETPDKGATVPKFGEWDENDPASADGYTHIFNKVREEKHTGSEKVPAMPTDKSNSNGHMQDNSDYSKMCCCLMWCKK